MPRVLIATSNPGKLRDFSGAAAAHGITVASVPDFDSLPGVSEDGTSFEENACKKAEHYSRFAPGEIVLADDSGLEVDALGGMPGLHSAHISSRLLQRLGGVTVIGPVIDGLQKPMQIVQMGATVSDLVNHAALAAYGALSRKRLQ